MAPRDVRDERAGDADDYDSNQAGDDGSYGVAGDGDGYAPWDGEPGGWSGEVYADDEREAYSGPSENRDRRAGRLRRSAQRLINAAAFVLPLILLAAWLAVADQRNGDSPSTSPVANANPPTVASASSPTGAWPSDVVFIRQTIPAMIKDLIGTPGERRGYVFEGAAGQVWTIKAEPIYGSALNPAVSVYAPDGAFLLQNDDRAAGDVTAEIVTQLGEDGPYRVIVEASGGASTGEYLFSLFAQ
jgi:hypothetical protein